MNKQKHINASASKPLSEEDYAAISEKVDYLAASGRKEGAVRELQKGLSLAESHHDEAYRLFFLGEIAHYKENDSSKSLELERRAATLKNDSSLILSNIGVQLCISGKVEESLEWFDKALEINPDDFHSLGSKGVALSQLGRDEEALECYDRALEINPEDFHSLRSKGESLQDIGCELEALECLNRALQINPDDVNSLRNRAYVLNKLGHTEEAEKVAEKAIKIQPKIEKRIYLDGIKAEQERKKAEAKAKERKIRMDAWRRLSARAAHRIGNQLFAARGALKVLGKQIPPESKETAHDLLEALKQIQRLNGQFKKFSATEKARIENVSVNNLVETIVRRYHNQAGEKNIRLRKILKTEIEWPMDRSMMEEALGELMENALTHTPSGGLIRLEAQTEKHQKKNRLLLTVENTCKGIDRKDKEKIFEAFFTTRPEGTGLGLAIVRKFVELHKGRIRETGKPGKYARFEIKLPHLEPEEAK